MSEILNEIDTVEMKFIPGYEGLYSATKDGRVYRHETEKKKGGFICTDRATAYIRIRLVKNGIEKWEAVHRLIALTFLENPENKPQVNHKNFKKHDNSVDNLEWLTWKENWEHARNHGKYRGRMLDQNEKIAIGLLHETKKYRVIELAKMFNISDSSIRRHIEAYKKAA